MNDFNTWDEALATLHLMLQECYDYLVAMPPGPKRLAECAWFRETSIILADLQIARVMVDSRFDDQSRSAMLEVMESVRDYRKELAGRAVAESGAYVRGGDA